MSHTTAERRDGTDPQAWRALWALVLGFFMILVDATIVSTAIPAITASTLPLSSEQYMYFTERDIDRILENLDGLRERVFPKLHGEDALDALHAADSTPFGHSAHADPDTCSTIIRTGSRSAATQGWHC